MLAIFAGRGADCAFRETVCKRLKEKTNITEISNGGIISEGVHPTELTAIFEKNPLHLQANGAVLILNRCSTVRRVSGERFCICNSANSEDVEIARRSGGEVITCGMSLRDSVTFSSFTDEQCVISIQRRLTRFDGSCVEPFELPLYCSAQEDRYGILCANLLLILGGYL